jgi:hypothetical protein
MKKEAREKTDALSNYNNKDTASNSSFFLLLCSSYLQI